MASTLLQNLLNQLPVETMNSVTLLMESLIVFTESVPPSLNSGLSTEYEEKSNLPEYIWQKQNTV